MVETVTIVEALSAATELGVEVVATVGRTTTTLAVHLQTSITTTHFPADSSADERGRQATASRQGQRSNAQSQGNYF